MLTTTVSSLQKLLATGSITTSGLVPIYLDQIEKHNHNGIKLNAMISITPLDLLMKRAAVLDDERVSGKLRSPLHGIPIIVKDNIWTDGSLGMDTTCGSYALEGAIAKCNAPVIDEILNAGMIILGKSNLTVSSASFSILSIKLSNHRNGPGVKVHLSPEVGLPLVARHKLLTLWVAFRKTTSG